MTTAGADWSVTGPEQVADGIFRIPLPLPTDSLRAVNVYALITDDGVTMIDGGWALAEAEEALRASLGKLSLSLADIRRFLVTHCHRDHYTQAVALRRTFGADVAIGIGEEPNLRQLTSGPEENQLSPSGREAILHRAGAADLGARYSVAVAGERQSGQWELPSRWLTPGSEEKTGKWALRAIATPGHTRGHLVFHEVAQGLLFAGDHVLPRITPSIGFEATQVAYPLRDFMSSLQLMLGLPDAILLPAHGPVAPSVHARVAELLDHHRLRLEAAFDAVERGADTGLAVAQQLTWTRHERTLAELGLVSQVMAVCETLAHLDVLALEERLACATGADGIARFQPS